MSDLGTESLPAALTTLVPQHDLYTLLVGQLRYALGRQSYIVSTTADLVRKYARELEPSQRDTLLADLRRHIEEAAYSEPTDIKGTWLNLRRDLESGRV